MENKEFDISGLRVLIALPLHDGRIHMECVAGIIEAVKKSFHYNCSIDVVYLKGTSLVQVARNTLANKMITDKSFDKLVWIDSDIGFKGGDLIRLIALSTEYPIVAGMYPIKSREITFKATPVLTDGHVEVNEHGLIKMVGMPLGFSIMDRTVFETLLPTEQRFWLNREYLPEFFKVYVEEEKVWGEDIEFCKQWIDVDGEVWCDPAILLEHWGEASYSGSFVDVLKTQGLINEKEGN